MRLLLAFYACAAAAGCAGGGSPAPRAPAARLAFEAISLLGDTLRAPALPAATRQGFEQRLREAERDVAARPNDPDALIWLGRRTAYLGRYREAIAIYTRGIARWPNDARFYRHRGHRRLTVRELDRAAQDLARAAELVRGRPDEVEPDGLPNARNTPTSTLQSNIWYHLGLARYLRGDFAGALAAYDECLTVSRNFDMLAATTYWRYLTLRRLGRSDEAGATLAPISRDLDIIENRSYHRLLLLFKGEMPEDSVLPPGERSSLDDATVGYGVGAWHLVNGRRAQATPLFQRVLEGTNWPAFGYLAAEAELARLRSR